MSRPSLSERRCVPCAGGVPAMHGEELASLLRELGGMWRVHDEHHLEKEYEFLDFEQALRFVVRVGELSLREGHYPDLTLSDSTVRIVLYTHKVGGLTESDFILASKIDETF